MKWGKADRSGTEPDRWQGTLTDGWVVPWEGMGVGPLTLTEPERKRLAEQLLGMDWAGIERLAEKSLIPYAGPAARSLFLHGTTPLLDAFASDLSRLVRGEQPINYAGYVEIRAPFLGEANDLTVGRGQSWRSVAEAHGLVCAEIPDLEHYYLSDALLLGALSQQAEPMVALDEVVAYVVRYPQVWVRLYALDTGMKAFLLWLMKRCGLEQIRIDANSPQVAKDWNTKSMLYPTLAAAEALSVPNSHAPQEMLALETQQSPLAQRLSAPAAALPGYTLERSGKSEAAFVSQVLAAARLLRGRYGVARGCLKAARAGDGSYITPNIDLADSQGLTLLAQEAYAVEDDFVLECHFRYTQTTFAGESIPVSPSVHIRSGTLAPGITLQLSRGSSWAGNVYVNETLAPRLGVSVPEYRQMRQSMQQLLQTIQQQGNTLVMAGVDFALGKPGGHFAEQAGLYLQDPNISFNGAEFLRRFMERVQEARGWQHYSFCAATWIFVPKVGSDFNALLSALAPMEKEASVVRVIAVVPGYWAMVGVASPEFTELEANFAEIKRTLLTNHVRINQGS
ncbi:MAG: hypothetical protein AAFQ98_14640 [Bacteroidota bacterium]